MSCNGRRGWALVALIALGIVFRPTEAAAVDCVDYRTFIHWEQRLELPSTALDLLIDEQEPDRAYAAMLTGIAAVSLADPAAPALIDSLHLWDFNIGPAAMALSDNRLWIAAGDGVIIVQSNPLVVTQRFQTSGEPHDIAFTGDLAVIADWDEGVQIYGTGGSSPTRLGGIDLPGFAAAVAVTGNRAYVADLLGLTVIDLSVPATPQILGSIILPGTSRDVTISNEIAYVVGNEGLQTVDVSDPRHPVVTDEFNSGGNRVLANESHLTLCNPNRLTFFALDDPLKPSPFGSLDLTDHTLGIASLDDRLYLAGSSLRVLNHENYAMPPVTGQVQLSSSVFEHLTIDGHLACAASNASLAVLDVSAPELPVIAGEIAVNGIRDLAADDGFAYLILDDACVAVDLADPALPTALDRVKLEENASDCALEAAFLYVVSPSHGLEVVEVTDPTQLMVRSRWNPLGSYHEVCAEGSIVYMGGYDFEGRPTLLIGDAADATTPHLIGGHKFDGYGDVTALAVQGTHAFMIVGGFYGFAPRLAILDVTVPDQPIVRFYEELSTLPAVANHVEVHGNLAYLWSEGDITILDVSDPGSPAVIGMRLEADSRGLSVTDQWIGVTNLNGFTILPLQCQTPAPVELASFEAEPVPGAIRLTWRTSREWDHLGFHVERALPSAGNFERLTRELIPAPGPYSYLDTQIEPGVTYDYRLAAMDRSGRIEHHGPWPATALPAELPTEAPLAFHLGANHPNPFSIDARETTITFSLAASGRTRLRLFDATGRVVATLVDAPLTAGLHQATWDGRTARGVLAAAGTYFYKLETGDFTATRQLVRLR